MSICAFNSFPFHYECIGFVLDYFQKIGKPLHVFTNTEDSFGWLEVYKAKFPSTFIFRPVEEYNDADWDYVIVLTDNDTGYDKTWTHAKMIMIEHSAPRRIIHPAAHTYLQLRQFNVRNPPSPSSTWLFPVWNCDLGPKPINARTKLVCIGDNMPTRPYELIDILPNFYDLDIVYINRIKSIYHENNAVWAEYSNVTIYEDLDARDLLAQAHSADYILMYPLKPQYREYNMSAMVPLAYSVGTPLLMVESWAKSFGLGGITIMDCETEIKPPTPEFLLEFQKQREELFARRDRVLQATLSQ